MLTFLEIAQRLRPRWVVWENVPGVLSSNGGRDFGSFLGALGELGYGWSYRVLDAQWFGVAQRRRRVFVVGHLGNWELAAKVLFESESVRRDSPPSREAGQGTSANAQEGVGAGGIAGSLSARDYKGFDRGDMHQLSKLVPIAEKEVVGCLSDGAHMGGGLNGQDAYTGRIMAVAEKKSHWEGSGVHPTLNQSFNTGAIGYSNQELFSQGGSGLVQAIPIHDQATRSAGKRGDKQDGKGNGLGVGKPGDPAPTLTKGDKHAVLYENHPNDSRVTGPHEVAPSCVSRFGTGGGNVPLVQEAVAFQESELRLTGKITEQAVCPTLKANTKSGDTEPKVIAFEPGIAKREGKDGRFVEEMSPTLRKEMGDNQVAVAVGTYNQALQETAVPIRSTASDICHTGGVINPKDKMAVRRLTPKECERLQGFSDDHTLIPWRNKPADQCPDGPRYKALGNSMAVPCMAWIGKRIDAADRGNRKASQ